ncbi:RodZ domain-containing protein [Alteromonas oceanisediminis]|uniref:RodZ domain-containing protein n=1 Tax=Alteromonas oceanisediminis TaxID=2836180 RepID=UPI001BD915EC|nr:RodZ domain-containing protein [Alteromonas oceanisediminis]MBT0585736.1 DUF4115 domain-containing protein [Alteromonas oceanisediminis]
MTEEQNEPSVEQSWSDSPGQTLRTAREAAGLTQQALADKLFLKVSIIQQLEADEITPKTSLTFTKGYVRLYAKHVGIDPAPVMASFDAFHKAGEPPQKLHSFSRRVSKQANDDRWMMVTYAILAVVVALVVWWWYQQSDNTDLSRNDRVNPTLEATMGTESKADESETESVPMSNQPDAVLPETTATPDEFEATNASNSETDTTPVNALPAEQSILNDQPALNEEPTLNEEPLSEGDENAALTPLVFTFSDDCWVNIVDSTGEAIAYGVKVKGRVMSVSGVAPFEVTLGAPQHVSILYAGEAVDMSGIPAGQTARFTLPMQG